MIPNRLNKSPIILNCFSRGGSNILWNYFLSHPNICHPLEETLQIFCTNIKAPRVEGYKVAFMEKRFLFNQWNFNERSTVKSKTAKYIDRVLYRKKITLCSVRNNFYLKPDPQTMLTTEAGTLYGTCAFIAAWRAGFCP